MLLAGFFVGKGILFLGFSSLGNLRSDIQSGNESGNELRFVFRIFFHRIFFQTPHRTAYRTDDNRVNLVAGLSKELRCKLHKS
jgi:hypothetical protein